MKIIEFYGYSRSGKTFEAKKINENYEYDDYFIRISEKKRFNRIILKILFLRFIKIKDLIFIYKIHNKFKYNSLFLKFKNFFSLMYLISFIRSNLNNKKPILIDHGLFQCLFSCFLFSINSPNLKALSKVLNSFFKDLNFNFQTYKIIEKKTDISIIKKRLKLTKKIKNLNYLENNEKKVHMTYFSLNSLNKFINNKKIIFEKINE